MLITSVIVVFHLQTCAIIIYMIYYNIKLLMLQLMLMTCRFPTPMCVLFVDIQIIRLLHAFKPGQGY